MFNFLVQNCRRNWTITSKFCLGQCIPVLPARIATHNGVYSLARCMSSRAVAHFWSAPDPSRWWCSGCPVRVSINSRDSICSDTSFSVGRLCSGQSHLRENQAFEIYLLRAFGRNFHIWITLSELVCVRRHVFTTAFGLFLRAFFYHFV